VAKRRGGKFGSHPEFCELVAEKMVMHIRELILNLYLDMEPRILNVFCSRKVENHERTRVTGASKCNF
jgi:hypothetical protein